MTVRSRWSSTEDVGAGVRAVDGVDEADGVDALVTLDTELARLAEDLVQVATIEDLT